MSAGTFEGMPALQKTTTSTGSIVANGQTAPLNSLSITWVDSNYVPKGQSGDGEYLVVTGTPIFPTAARINDTGTFYKVNRYATSSKAVLLGTETVSYLLEADTVSTALLTIIFVEKNTSGITTSTNRQQFRITPAGTFKRLSSTGIKDTLSLTITY